MAEELNVDLESLAASMPGISLAAMCAAGVLIGKVVAPASVRLNP